MTAPPDSTFDADDCVLTNIWMDHAPNTLDARAVVDAAGRLDGEGRLVDTCRALAVAETLQHQMLDRGDPLRKNGDAIAMKIGILVAIAPPSEIVEVLATAECVPMPETVISTLHERR